MAKYSSCSWVGDSVLEQDSFFVVCKGCEHLHVGDQGKEFAARDQVY